MSIGLIGKKVGMTQIYTEEGNVIPVTVIKVGPCLVVEKKTSEKHGYNALKIGFDEISEDNITKPASGVFKKKNIKPQRYIKEFRVAEGDYEEGTRPICSAKASIDAAGRQY